jgi:hypothetical protein
MFTKHPGFILVVNPVQLPTEEGINPIVFATFKGTIGDKPKRRVLFYG